MLKLLKAILRNSKWVLNNKGFVPWVIPTAITGGSALLNYFGSRGGGDEDPQWYVDPWTQRLRDIMGPRLDPSYYNIPQTGVEGATERGLLSRLGRGVGDIRPSLGPEAAAKYYEAEKLKRGERFGEEQSFLKDLYQREGVLTSTPGIEAQVKLKRQQGAEMGAFSERLMYEDIARDLQATQMAENIIMQTLNQGMMLGGQQRQALQWPYVMAQGAMGQAQGLGSMGYMPGQGSSLMSELGSAGMDIGKLMLMMQMFSGGGAAAAGGGGAAG